MTATVLDPADPDDGAWCDALLGLDRACRSLAALLDEPGVAAAAGGADLEPPGDPPDDLLDAVLGLVSLRTTIGLVLEAARGEAPDAAGPAGAADWSRELLR